jgi:hypothetical protein
MPRGLGSAPAWLAHPPTVEEIVVAMRATGDTLR